MPPSQLDPRHLPCGPRRTGSFLVAVGALVGMVLLAGCGDRAGPSGSPELGSGPADTPVAVADDVAAVLGRILQPEGRDLIGVLEPGEALEATITVARPDDVARAARTIGLHAEVMSVEDVRVVGPTADVLAFVAKTAPTWMLLADDHRVDRWLPAARPEVQLPLAGRPYTLAPLVVDRSRLQMNEALQPALLSELARTIETIDGRPYDRIQVYGECSGRPPSCFLSAQGSQAATGGRVDQYLVVSDASTGNRPRLDSTIREAVPRSLLRAAEWIARHDADAAGAIASYDTCCSAQWDPARPGQIGLVYTRSCKAALVPAGRDVAATGDCFDILTVVVDLGTATVVSTKPSSGTSGG